VLRQRGHLVNPAINFHTATKLAGAIVYDLVISDIELPDGSGLDIIRELRRSRPTPGIALSGFGSVDDVVLSLEAGFAEHLTKPINVRELDAAIARVIVNRGNEVGGQRGILEWTLFQPPLPEPCRRLSPHTALQ
jgi:two-component system CheB/CheR fusion protein